MRILRLLRQGLPSILYKSHLGGDRVRILCLDVGDARIGVAVSDALGLTAQSVETIFTKGVTRDLERVEELLLKYDTRRVLVGLPLNMDSSEGPQALKARSFGTELEKRGYEVRYLDERLTTKSAARVLIEADMSRKKRKQYIDRLAACYILQTMLDSGGWREKEKSNENLEDREMTENDNMKMEPLDVVTLIDEDGKEVEFEHLLTLEHNGKTYICLAPVNEEDEEDDELVILRLETDENGEDAYVTIEDEEELDDVFEKYLEIVEADEEEDGK